MNMRTIFSVLFCVLFSQFTFSQTTSPIQTTQTKKTQAYLDYIEKYYPIAIKKMQEHGIPASITLAQALLESSAGSSEIAVKGNNHFGIKCHEWDGEKIYHDDDIKNDCFRKYATPEESFEDHSAFLKRPRYAQLYDLNVTDYAAWANGLKQCGYATDPNYASRLVDLIETYELYNYDKGVTIIQPSKEEQELAEAESHYVVESDMGTIPSYNAHQIINSKGKKAVIAGKDDTYEGIAKEFGLRNWEIRRYNKAKKGNTPTEGQTVFIRWY